MSTTRTITVCHACGIDFDRASDPAPIRGCDDHGVRLVDVEVFRPTVDLTASQIAEVRAAGGAETWCALAEVGVEVARRMVAEAWASYRDQRAA